MPEENPTLTKAKRKARWFTVAGLLLAILIWPALVIGFPVGPLWGVAIVCLMHGSWWSGWATRDQALQETIQLAER